MSSNSRITTSWVIRTKNEEKHIGEVLEMLQKQTRQDFEIIIVDSGSTDETLEIIKNFPTKLIQIKPEEFNYGFALNLSIKESRGQFIGILSGHSVPITKNFYANGMKFFSDPKIAAISGNYIESKIKFAGKALSLLRDRHFTSDLTNTNSLIRKDLWTIYPFDEKLKQGCEDRDWALEMLARGYDIVKVPSFSTIYYRVNNKPSYQKMKPVWDKICKELDHKKRPSKSFSTINIP